jgi:DNA mismatch repair protein MutS
MSERAEADGTPVLAAGASPMVSAYAGVKESLPGFTVLYRVGEFYEVLLADAAKVSRALGIQLTRRRQKNADDIPMCGIPAAGAQAAVARLLGAGMKVALSEQAAEPGGRRPVRLMTPGTTLNDDVLCARLSNNLLLVDAHADMASYAWIDLSTGEAGACSATLAGASAVLARVAPAEIVVLRWPECSELLAQAVRASGVLFSAAMSAQEAGGMDGVLSQAYGASWQERLRGFSPGEVSAFAALLSHVAAVLGQVPNRIQLPRRAGGGDAMEVDQATLRGLEVFTSPSGRQGSLVAVMDRTVTPAGARLLERQLAAPLTDPATIGRRLEMVRTFVDQPDLRADCRQALEGFPDVLRACGRLSLGKGGPRDLAAVRDILKSASVLASVMARAGGALPVGLAAIARDLVVADGGALAQVRQSLSRALSSELPRSPDGGGFVAPGFDRGLDALRAVSAGAEEEVAALQARYVALTGVKALRIRSNSLIGHHVEVPNSAAEAMRRPEFTMRQGLASSGRYATTELDALASRLDAASQEALSTERAVFDTLSSEVLLHKDTLAKLAHVAAALDLVAGLAQAAVEGLWSEPEVVDGQALDIVDGRHPVAELRFSMEGRTFVANDCTMDEDSRLWLMTGPNMSGKSTFLRQVALIALMAQTGSFVPAERCRVGVVDKLFSRIGASDDLAMGRSTFMVEMMETAAILNQATARSLVILDEVGRGTSTYDGLSIAQACMENLHDTVGCRTLFATHYHELAEAADSMPYAACMAMESDAGGHGASFSHKVRPGRAGRSHGIRVAEMAGMPRSVVERAAELLAVYAGPDALDEDAAPGP